MKILQAILFILQLIVYAFDRCFGKKIKKRNFFDFNNLPAVIQLRVIAQMGDNERLLMSMTSTKMSATVRSAQPLPRRFVFDNLNLSIVRENGSHSYISILASDRKTIEKGSKLFSVDDLECYLLKVYPNIMHLTVAGSPEPKLLTIFERILTPFRGAHTIVLNLDLRKVQDVKHFAIEKKFPYPLEVSLSSDKIQMEQIYSLLRFTNVRRLTLLGDVVGDQDIFMYIDIDSLYIKDHCWFCTKHLSSLRCRSLFVADVSFYHMDLFTMLRLWKKQQISSNLRLIVILTNHPRFVLDYDQLMALDALPTMTDWRCEIPYPRSISENRHSKIELTRGFEISRQDGTAATFAYFEEGIVFIVGDIEELTFFT